MVRLMHRTATKMKTRKHRSPRNGHRRKPARNVTPSVPAVRPANDTVIDLVFAADPGLEPDFARSAGAEIDVVTASLASVETDNEEVSLTEALVTSTALEDAEPAEAIGEAPEEGDDSDSEAAADAEADDEQPVAVLPSPKSDEPQSFLAMYFRDMAELSVLKPERIRDWARAMP